MYVCICMYVCVYISQGSLTLTLQANNRAYIMHACTSHVLCMRGCLHLNWITDSGPCYCPWPI